MSDRRSARRQARADAATPTPTTAPTELVSRTHAFWSDRAAVRTRYGQWLPKGRSVDERTYLTVLTAWALANGYESHHRPGTVDYRAMQRAGVIHSPARARTVVIRTDRPEES